MKSPPFYLYFVASRPSADAIFTNSIASGWINGVCMRCNLHENFASSLKWEAPSSHGSWYSCFIITVLKTTRKHGKGGALRRLHGLWHIYYVLSWSAFAKRRRRWCREAKSKKFVRSLPFPWCLLCPSPIFMSKFDGIGYISMLLHWKCPISNPTELIGDILT